LKRKGQLLKKQRLCRRGGRVRTTKIADTKTSYLIDFLITEREMRVAVDQKRAYSRGFVRDQERS